ncbi:MAG: CHAP domain-containing protein [Acidocella sp.]|nr:CHAP domain-containing protein [Acidocella sp.]
MASSKKSISLSGAIRALLMGVSVAATSLFTGHGAQASTRHHVTHATHLATTHHSSHVKPASLRSSTHHTQHHQSTASTSRGHQHMHLSDATYRVRHMTAANYRHSGLQCVPYAREVSHINLSGNAFLWWAKAAGRYARGNSPVEGAVLNFRAIGRMPLGHVAVVTSVLDNRTILVTQANWVRGTITNDVTVQDVSPNNDWSQVQVELGDSSKWGAAYPTYGFIYNRPDTGTVIAANGRNNEVAMAPAAAPVSSEAPNRNLQ